MMFLAWGILILGGVLVTIYFKHLKGDGWFQIHVNLQYSGIVVMLLGFLFVATKLKGFHIEYLHVKFGVAAIFFTCWKPVNAYLCPKKDAGSNIPQK